MSDEYIRKQDAVSRMSELLVSELHMTRCPTWNEVYNAIGELPPADVAPVEYGEWISVPEMWGAFDVRYYCSKCGKNAIINNSERYVLSDYCPHCGSFNGGKK